MPCFAAVDARVGAELLAQHGHLRGEVRELQVGMTWRAPSSARPEVTGGGSPPSVAPTWSGRSR